MTSPQNIGIAEDFAITLKQYYAKLAERQDSQTVMEKLPKWFHNYNSCH